MSTAERIAWGLLSFIALIAWCRWEGTPEDQREVTPCRKEENAKKETVRSIRLTRLVWVTAIDGALKPRRGIPHTQ
jgi:hypothetical protein